ncbi:MAG TPA: hypothetical protein VLT36_20925 [Candidatus Dormibacteraeota bacterium]|nr:hypothetical protein [Candidatus Dormibacteraeota bacterium]
MSPVSARGGTAARRMGNRAAKSRLGRQTRFGARTAGRSGRTGGSQGGGSKTTQDHEEIRQWVESRGGHPAIVKRTARGTKNKEGVLRIDFPGYSGAGTLEEVSWDEWFQVFDDRNLEFLYQDKTSGGKPSRFNKLVCPS